MIPLISSLQNPSIKNIQKLEKSSERKSQNKFVVEGAKEISIALNSNYQLVQLYFCPEIADKSQSIYHKEIFDAAESLLTEISFPVFEKLAYRENSDGLIALFLQKSHAIQFCELGNNPTLLILESIEKPGNLGAILRTADAAGIDAVMICDPKTDIYNPNVVRSSIGCVFSVQCIIATNDEVLNFCKQNNIKSFATTPSSSLNYTNVKMDMPCAIILGTEADGLSDFWLDNADQKIKINMQGKIDSLNVANCASIFTFEVLRQKSI